MFERLKISAIAALLGWTGCAAAQEMGRVISSTALVQQVAIPKEVCTQSQVTVPQSKSGAGAVMGAIAGGALGNSVGAGTGRALSTMIGVLGGAAVGNSIEGASQPQLKTVQNCSTQTHYENRVTGYNVIYEYAGKQYQVQTPNDPGAYVPLQVTPVVPVIPAAPVTPATTTSSVQVPVSVSPAVVYVPVARGGYYASPVSVGIGVGFGHGWYGRYHRPWY